MNYIRPLVLALACLSLSCLSLPVSPACADTLGVGSFDLDLDLSGGLPAPSSGTITFDNSPQNFFGTPVNMATQVGALQFDNTLSFLLSVDPTVPTSGRFTVSAFAISNPSLFSFTGSGHYVCAGAGCLTSAPDSFIGDAATLSGSFYTSTLQWIGAVYTSEGGILCCIGAGCVPSVAASDQHCTGTFALNGFVPSNTPASGFPSTLPLSGTFYNTLINALQTTSVDVTFKKVTAGGTTTLTATSNLAGTIPPNFKVDLPGFQPIYFGVGTTAGSMGNIKVCLHYQDDGNGHLLDTSIPETQLRLIHQVGGMWDANTNTTVDTVNNVVCATVGSLSPFGLVVRDLGNIPATSGNLKCEDAVAKNLAKLAGGVAKCQVKAADGAFRQRPIDEGQCEADARAKYDAKNARLSGCPQCLLDAVATVADGVQSAFGAVPVQTYCDGTTPIPATP